MNQGGYAEEALESMQQRLRVLDEENTRLRNNVLTCNDEIYSLRAVAVTVEAELKYNTEVELAKMESELKFRSKELAALSRDHEKALKELAMHKQRAVTFKPSQVGVEVDTMDTDYAGDTDFQTSYSQQAAPSQAGATAAKVHTIHEGTTDTVLANHTAVPAALESTSLMAQPRITSAQAVNTSSSSSTAVSPRATISAVQDIPGKATLDAGELRRGRTELLSLTYQKLLASMVQESTKQNTSLSSAASFVDVLADFFPVSLESDKRTETLPLILDALISLSQSLLENARCEFHNDKNCEAIGGAISLLHALALLDCLVGILLISAPRSNDHERDGSDIATVVGNLQNKFELAASAGKCSDPSAAGGIGHRAQAEGAQPRWAHAIKTPALTATQRATAWCAGPVAASSDTSSGGSLHRLNSSRDNCARFLWQVLAFSGELSDANSIRRDFAALLQQIVRSCANFFAWTATIESSMGRTSSNTVADHDCRAALMGICSILQSSVSLGVRCETCSMLASYLTSDSRNFRALSHAHITPGEQPRISPLTLAVKHLGKPADFPLSAVDTPCDVVLYQCQVAFLFMKLLHRYGGRFVLMLLGLDPSHAAGNGDKSSTSDRSKGKSVSSDSSSNASDHANHENKAASAKRTLPQEADAVASNGLAHVTPLHPRKLVKSGRSELQRDSQSNRITPSSHGSGGAGGAPRSHRKLSPGETLDLKDCLHLADRGLLSDIVRTWMRHIRRLDSCSVLCRGSTAEAALVRLVQLLSLFLSEALDLLAPQDCAVLVSDVTEVFHEYIYRCNTGGWHPALRMSDSLFSFLENRQHESSA